MAQWQLKSKRKITGGLLRRHMKKKRYQRGRDFVPTHIGVAKAKKQRVHGGAYKKMILVADTAFISVAGKIQKAKIITVKQNPADSQFVRRNIITKGAIIETDLGEARVTSRPGQYGVVNAVLVKKK
ncbi:MAG: 30S ribosomal protein S8e [Candidatus Aenigmarchaeota archaeon]|nr:30S ribosomal protein S8e [Candidatus Aenigmarchaeota archaeon]